MVLRCSLLLALLFAGTLAGETVRDHAGNTWTLDADVLRVGDSMMPLPMTGSSNMVAAIDGRIWLQDRDAGWWSRSLSLPKWQAGGQPPAKDNAAWESVARLPFSNHDLSGDVLHGVFYMAGGLTAEYGMPPRSHAPSQLFAYDGAAWRVAAELGRPRIYAGTSHLDGKLWIVGGDTLLSDGERVTTNLVQVVDPASGHVSLGPLPKVARPMALCLHAAGRLYVLGASRMESIGTGETAWRDEPAGPLVDGPLAGVVHADKLYVVLPHRGLAVYDARAKSWSQLAPPESPRSCQVAAFKNEIWLIGGRGVRDGRATHIYSIGRKRWRRGPDLPRELVWGAGFTLNGVVHVAGGAAGSCYSDRTFRLRPAPTLAKPQLTAWDNRLLTGRSGPDFDYETDIAFPEIRFKRPVHLVSVPGSEPERLMGVDLEGPIRSFVNRPDASQLDLAIEFPRSHRLYAIAFHPDYPATPEAFVFYNQRYPGTGTNTVSRFRMAQLDPPVLDPASEEAVIRWWSKGHDGGDLCFGPDGMLYISSGDGQAPADPAHSAQNVDDLLGAILRIDVSERPYRVPPDNPFVGMEGVRPEQFCYGHRNPWKMSFSPEGDLWVGDNGDEQWESIYRCTAGCNHGWSTYEGSHPYRLDEGLKGPSQSLAGPVAEHPHTEMRSAIGGRVCRDPRLPGLHGRYLYGDYVTGKIWGLRWADGVKTEHEPVADLREKLLAFSETREGTFLVLRNDGLIARLKRSDRGERPAFPARLSEAGLFANTRSRQPAAGVVPYQIQHPMWRDGLETERHVALPSGEGFRVDRNPEFGWEMGEGGVAMLTLIGSNQVPVETQLILRESEIYYFYSYAWNEAGDDAELVPAAGTTIRGHRFASRSECMVCHTAANNFLLGVRDAQLNLGDQLACWNALGLTREPHFAHPATVQAWPRRDDPNAGSEQAARTWLHVNCAHCHQEGGAGGRGDFVLFEHLGLGDCGLAQAPKLDLWQLNDPQLVAPQAPDRSMILKRISVRGAGQMPLFGSDIVDREGVALLRRWIESLPHTQSR